MNGSYAKKELRPLKTGWPTLPLRLLLLSKQSRRILLICVAVPPAPTFTA